MTFENSQRWLPECPPTTSSLSGAIPQHVYIISLRHKIDDFRQRSAFLSKFGVTTQRWPAIDGSTFFNASEYYTVFDQTRNANVEMWHSNIKNVTLREDERGFLTLGERGYLESLRRLFLHALADPGIQSMLVMDEDVLFDCNFDKRIAVVLKDRRCGGIVAEEADEGPRGVLLLGGAMWEKSDMIRKTRVTAWNLTHTDITRRVAQFSEAAQCFNVHSRMYGSFAIIYHRNAFKTILQWIETAAVPFDNIWSYLHHHHVPVRVAHPFVAIQDVRHPSTVDLASVNKSNLLKRAKLHHWQLQRYCMPDFTPVIRTLTAADYKA